MIGACPHCRKRLKWQTALNRRAAATCPGCRQRIWVDPFQTLYPNQLCLTELQAKYVSFLMALTDLPCGAAVAGNLEKVRNSVKKSDRSPIEASIVRRLTELAMERCTNREEEQMLIELTASFERFDQQRSPAKRSARRAFSLRALFSF